MEFLLYFGASADCNLLAPPIIPEGLNYKKEIYVNFKTLMACFYISGFFCRFLFLIWSTVGQILNVIEHHYEVWCVLSATCGS